MPGRSALSLQATFNVKGQANKRTLGLHGASVAVIAQKVRRQLGVIQLHNDTPSRLCAMITAETKRIEVSGLETRSTSNGERRQERRFLSLARDGAG